MRMDLLPYNNENVLIEFPPILKKNFEELFRTGEIGLAPLTLNDVLPTKHYYEDDFSYSYCYNIKIPYAGKRLVWEVIFDPDDMSFAPDFSFNDDSFALRYDIDKIEEYIPSLANWNVNNHKSLTTLLRECLGLYKRQQIEKLEQDNIYAQLNSDYQVLTEEVLSQDLEIYLESTCAHFLINITVDTALLPEYLQSQESDQILNPGKDTCILKVSYLKLDGTRVKTSLQLSPRLDQILGSTPNLAIPTYKATSLADYLNLVMDILQDQIKKVGQRHKLRKEFITCLSTIFADKIIEFDTETFSKSVILVTVDNFECMVQIELGELFPDEPPIVTLFSLYCVPVKKICSEQVNDYLYSPRWEPQIMLNKLMTNVRTAIRKFKNHKH